MINDERNAMVANTSVLRLSLFTLLNLVALSLSLSLSGGIVSVGRDKVYYGAFNTPPPSGRQCPWRGLHDSIVLHYNKLNHGF